MEWIGKVIEINFQPTKFMTDTMGRIHSLAQALNK